MVNSIGFWVEHDQPTISQAYSMLFQPISNKSYPQEEETDHFKLLHPVSPLKRYVKMMLGAAPIFLGANLSIWWTGENMYTL